MPHRRRVPSPIRQVGPRAPRRRPAPRAGTPGVRRAAPMAPRRRAPSPLAPRRRPSPFRRAPRRR